MSNLKLLRKKKKLTLKELSNDLKRNGIVLSPDSLAKYERGEREPKLETWERLANYFSVSTPYLMGLSDDLNGWDAWTKSTGYSKTEILEEIKRLETTKRLDPNEGMQAKISRAVSSLEIRTSDNTQDLRNVVIERLLNLQEDLERASLVNDPPPQFGSYDELAMWISQNPQAIYRKDIDQEALDKMRSAITKAINEINHIQVD